MSVLPASTDFEIISGLSRELGLTLKQVGELIDIHPRTLLRRQEHGHLEAAELLRAQMLSEVLSLATVAFHDPKRAKDWLFAELPALDFARPIDQLGSIPGYERVKILLGQSIFGVY
jgi:putative toxin-antitoxin system antitoxin component (TIGR02293 family)